MTAIEFFHDVVAMPIAGRFHDYMGCGYQASAFDRRAGQTRYRAEVSQSLEDYGDGYEVDLAGKVVRAVPTGIEILVDEQLPASAGAEHRATPDHAIASFRARRSSREDQLDALRH